MAAPNITIDVIAQEGLRRAGYPTPSAEQVKRVKDVWLPELVNQVVSAARATGIGVLSVFQTTAVAVGKTNQSRYQLPDDFDDELSVTLLDGDTTGTAQGGNSAAITLAAGETITQADAEGAHVLVTAGAAKGQYRQITAYNTTTKEATVDVSWDFAKVPTSGDTYRVVDEEDAIELEYVPRIDDMRTARDPGRPVEVTIHNAEFIFDRPLDDTYGLKLRYYADPAKLDLTEARWTDLFTRWQHLLTVGLAGFAMEENDDTRKRLMDEEFERALAGVIRREQPEYGEFKGFALSEIRQ